MNWNMVKPGKYDHNIQLLYNISTKEYFQFINFLVGQCV